MNVKNTRGFSTVVLLASVLVGTLSAGWLGPKIERRWNNQNKKVEQAQNNEAGQKERIIETEKKAVVEAHKDVKSSGFAIDDGNLRLAKDFNSRADLKLTVVDGGIDPLIVLDLRQQITNLQSKNEQIRREAEIALAKEDTRSEIIFQQLSDQRVQLLGIQEKLRIATDKLQDREAVEAAQAEKYQRLKFFFWASIVLGLVFFGFGLYTRLFTLSQVVSAGESKTRDVLGRVANFTNSIKTAVGSETHAAIIHNLDVNFDDWMQQAVSKARATLPAVSSPVPSTKNPTP